MAGDPRIAGAALHITMLALILGLVTMLLPSLASGQANATGTISGTVSDQSGAMIVGAKVTITDTGTKISHSQPTNQVGHFIFADLDAGTYDVSVTKAGFRNLSVPGQAVVIGQTITLTLAMEVGAATQTVEVTATPGAELQTTSSTMSTTIANDTLLELPNINRDVASLLNYQATAAPTFHNAYAAMGSGDIVSGSIAGATPDQNTFMLDGVNNTSGLEGDNGYINGFSGDQRGIVPTPVESIAEVTVNTNNMGAEFNTSIGGEMLAVTKRGHDQFHGASYDFFQADWLNSNDWNNNFTAVPKPKSHQNRFGGDIGGPMLPNFLGGKTFFFFNYEGQRYPFNTTGEFTRTVPSDALRQGIIQINTAEGVQSFNLNQPLNVCGAHGGEPCDPRGIGMSSMVSTMWSQYMPEPNYLLAGDKLNTFGYRANLTLPLDNDILIGRIDHDFGSNFRWYTRYSWYKQNVPTTNEVDIGGLLKGDTKGVPAAASSNNNQPGVIVTGLDTTISPTLTNSFHYGFTRNEWNWIRNGVAPQISGSAGAIEIDGESSNALIPINVDTQDSRNRAWYEHNTDIRDELTWLKGSHLFQFGGDMLHEWWHFNRYDNVVGGLTNLVYEVDDSSVHMTPDFEPQTCGGSVTTQCLDPASNPSSASEINTWKEYYADLLGIVDHSTVVATRTGANLALNPLGTPAASYVTVNTPSVYISDAWKVKANLTINYGLSYVVQMPPHDLNGRQDVLVDPSGNPITYDNYIADRQAAALGGQVYLPTAGFSPVGAVGNGLKYPFRPFYGGFGPRVSVAWSPNWDNGWLGKFLGHKSTVVRGGYGRFYGRDLGINIVSNPMLGDGFLQPVTCTGPTSPAAQAANPGLAACQGQDAATPATVFRMGGNADGLAVPLPAISPTLSSPVQPGIGATPSATLLDSMDNDFRPSDTDQIDFSVQRQFKDGTLVEVGYLGVWGHHLFQGIDMNSVPWMMTQGGQSFAQAYAGLWKQLTTGTPANSVMPQPFFEAALTSPPKGSPSGTPSYLQAYNASLPAGATACASATCAVANNEGPNVFGEDVTNLWSDLDTQWNFGNALYSTNQSFYGPYANTSDGFSNYQALVVKVSKRASHGLTMNFNATYGHALGTLGLAQTYTLDTPDNVYNLRRDWTPQPYDRKFTMNLLGTYQLPFGPGQRWSGSNGIVNRLMGGWSVSPILSWGSGLPLEVFTGGQEMGAGFAENGAEAVPVGINTAQLSNSNHGGIVVPDPTQCSGGTCSAAAANPSAVGIHGNPTYGGSGENMFANPISTYNSFRPFVLGVDGSPSPDGQLRQPIVWTLDLGINKQTLITERVRVTFYTSMINVLNHTNWAAPTLNLQDPADFGVMSGGLGSLGNYGRVIELGARVSF